MLKSFRRLLNKKLNKKGQSVVEMALILPIILLIIMGILDFGRIMNAQIQISSASRSGSRVASIGYTDSQIVTVVKSTANILDPAKMIITITPSGSSRSSEDLVTVKVEYDITVITPGVSILTGNPFRLTSETSMIVE